MKQKLIGIVIVLGVLFTPYQVVFAQSNNTKCPPAKSFYKNKQKKKLSIKLPELPKIKVPKLPKIKLPDITAIKLPKLKKPQMPSFDFLKPDNKQVASTKCPK